MNQEQQLKVEKIKTRIEEKSKRIPFKYTKVGRFLDKLLKKDPIDIILDKIDDHIYKQETKRLKKEGYQGDINDYDEIALYEERIQNKPIRKEKNNDGSTTFYYPDGLKIIKYPNVLESVFPSIEIQEECMKSIKENNQRIKEEKQKQLFSGYTRIQPEIIKTMPWEEIDRAILANSTPAKRLVRTLSPRKYK